MAEGICQIGSGLNFADTVCEIERLSAIAQRLSGQSTIGLQSKILQTMSEEFVKQIREKIRYV